MADVLLMLHINILVPVIELAIKIFICIFICELYKELIIITDSINNKGLCNIKYIYFTRTYVSLPVINK